MDATARIGRKHPLSPNVSSDGDDPLESLSGSYTVAQRRVLTDKVEPPAVPFFPSGRTVSVPTISRGVVDTLRSPQRTSLTPTLPDRPAPVLSSINFDFNRNGRQTIFFRSVQSPSTMHFHNFSESPHYRIPRAPRDAIYPQNTKRMSWHRGNQQKVDQRSGRSGFPHPHIHAVDGSFEDEVAQDMSQALVKEEKDHASIATRFSSPSQLYYKASIDTNYPDSPPVLISPTERTHHEVGLHCESFRSPSISPNLISSPVSQKYQPPSTGPSSSTDLLKPPTPFHSPDHPSIEPSTATSSHSQTLRYSRNLSPFPATPSSETNSAPRKTVHPPDFLSSSLSTRLKELTLRVALTRCELCESTNPNLALTTSMSIALPLAQQLGYIPLEGRCWYWAGRAEAARGNLRKAQEALERSLEAGLEGVGMKERVREGRDVRAVLEVVRGRIAKEIERGEGSPGVSPTLISPLDGVGVRVRDIRQFQKETSIDMPERLEEIGWIRMTEDEMDVEIEEEVAESHKKVSEWQGDVNKTTSREFTAEEMNTCGDMDYSQQSLGFVNPTIREKTDEMFSTPAKVQAKPDAAIMAIEESPTNEVFVTPRDIPRPSHLIFPNGASNDGDQEEEEENNQDRVGEYQQQEGQVKDFKPPHYHPGKGLVASPNWR